VKKMKIAVVLAVVFLLAMPLVFAKAKYYPVQSVQQPIQHDSLVVSSLPSWSGASRVNWTTTVIGGNQITGQNLITGNLVSRMGNYYMPTVPGSQTGTTVFTVAGSQAFSRGKSIGTEPVCSSGSVMCDRNVFKRCIGLQWVTIETCKLSEVCTMMGCRMQRWSRQPIINV
jgi:hypothetical protein